MDIISDAIKKEKHLYDGIETENQKWTAFWECIKMRQLFLFGTGQGMNYFLRNYGDKVQIAGVIDNDARIQGQQLGACCGEAWQTVHGALIIYDPKVLMGYRKQDIVVLITSINFYPAMIKQMEEMGIENNYVLVMMEAAKRECLTDNEAGEDSENIRDSYIGRCCLQNIEEKKIVMLIGVYGSHARQITKALLKERKDLDIVWIVNDLRMERPEGVRFVYEKNWKQYVYEMETARIWIFDDIIPTFIRKREGQIYIQVKHWSSITLKKFYLDDKSPVLTPEVERAIKQDGARMDYLFSGSEFDEASCKSGFLFRGQNVRIGSPRSDVLFKPEIRDSVREWFGLGKGTKICLYAPTYRLQEFEESHSMHIVLDMVSLRKALQEKWGGEWYIFVRLHPSLELKEDEMFQNRYIIYAGSYLCGEELAAASDVLITDYSSIMFEGAYVKKKVFLYAPDRQKFIGQERELLIDYDELPFPLAASDAELHQMIRNFDVAMYERKVTEFLRRYGVCEDGHASKRAAEFILNLIGER